MAEYHYIHHGKPLIARVLEQTEGFDLDIWRVVSGADMIKSHLDFHDIESQDVDKMDEEQRHRRAVHVELKFSSSGIPQEAIEGYLTEYHFFDSDLADHRNPHVPFRLDIGVVD